MCCRCLAEEKDRMFLEAGPWQTVARQIAEGRHALAHGYMAHFLCCAAVLRVLLQHQ